MLAHYRQATEDTRRYAKVWLWGEEFPHPLSSPISGRTPPKLAVQVLAKDSGPDSMGAPLWTHSEPVGCQQVTVFFKFSIVVSVSSYEMFPSWHSSEFITTGRGGNFFSEHMLPLRGFSSSAHTQFQYFVRMSWTFRVEPELSKWKR